MNNKNLRLLFLVLMMAFSVGVHAQLKIEITGFGSTSPQSGFCVERRGGPPKVTEIVAADLNRSVISKSSTAVGSTLNVPGLQTAISTWKTRGADHVVIGSVSSMSMAMGCASPMMFGRRRSGFAYRSPLPIRNTALHKIADAIYEK